MRIVADTNLVLSAFLWRGQPLDVLNAARDQIITLFTSPALMAELEDVLGREKFAAQIARIGAAPSQLVQGYIALAELVRVDSVPAVTRDPKDDKVLACALAAQANAIASGDKDLLVLKEYQGIPILTAGQLLQRLQPGEKVQ